MKFKEMLAERKSFNNWQKMDDKALRHEYDIEYTIKPLKGMLGDIWPKFDDFKRAYAQGKVVSVTSAFDRKIRYRSRTRSRDEIISLIKGYASYPKFRNEKTIDGIFAAFENGESMNMPIVLDLGDGTYRIMGGNTRMDIAIMMGITPKVMVIPAYETISEETDEKTGFIQIAESLNTPQEYWMTEDTNLPHSVYAAFQLDGEVYSVSFLKSGKSNIYIAELNRMVNVNKKLWSFKKTSHIRPAISTFIRIIESTIPFVMSHCHGIAIPVPKGVDSPRFNTMVKRVMKKVLIQKFQDVPVQYNENHKNGKSYIFAIRKGMDPKQVFKTKAYWGFDFNATSKKEIPVEALDELKPAKKPVIHPSIVPHKKFQFAGVDVKTVDGHDEYVDTENTLKVFNKDTASDEAKEKAKEEAIKAQEEKLNSKLMTAVGFIDQMTDAKNGAAMPQGFMPDEEVLSLTDAFGVLPNDKISPIAMIPKLFPSMAQKLQDYGFDESKVNWGDFEYVLKQVIGDDPALKEFLPKSLYNPYGMNDEQKDAWRTMMKSYANWSQQNHVNPNTLKGTWDMQYGIFKKAFQYKQDAEEAAKIESDKLQALKDDQSSATEEEITKADYDIDFKTGDITPPIGLYEVGQGSGFIFRTFPHQNHQKKTDIEAYWYEKYKDEFSKFKYENSVGWERLRQYTSNYYKTSNPQLRDAFKFLIENDIQTLQYTLDKNTVSKMCKMMEIFNKVKPLDEGVWVYRNALIPDLANDLAIGKDLVDPAFLSTSLSQDIQMGNENNARLTIYVPKGSPAIPITKDSGHPGEVELILPPFSVLRPLEYVTKSTGYQQKTHVKCIYVGNGGTDYLTKLAESVNVNHNLNDIAESVVNRILDKLMTEDKNKKDNVYDDSMPSMKEMEKYKEAIKSGKIKLDTPKKGK